MRDINGKLRWPLLLVVVWGVLMVSGMALALTQWTTNVPSSVTVILAPTPIPSPTPTPSPTPAPNPSLSVSPPSVDFGQVIQGQGSGSYTLTLTNTGNVLFDTFAVALSGAPAGVTLTGTGLPGTLAPGASQDISLSLLVDTGVSPASYPFNMVITAYY